MDTSKKSLTRKEELIMLSILSLKQEAYLIAIVDHLADVVQRNVSVTSVYFPLERLEKLGWIESAFGEATAVRGGRRKKIYAITRLGHEVLEEHKRVSDLLWKDYAGIPTTKE